MKIIIITNWWLNSDGGGILEYTRNLVQSLLDEGNDVKLIFRMGEDASNFSASRNKIKFILDAIRILRNEKPDAILCQGGWFAALPAILFSPLKKKSKSTYLFHSLVYKKISFIKRHFNSIILNRIDEVGFVCKALRQNIQEVGGLNINKPTFILYAGVKVPTPSARDMEIFKEEFKISPDDIVLLALGLTAHYGKKEGAKDLISAMNYVKKKCPQAKLLLTRKGIYYKELVSYSDSQDSKDVVIFTGDINDPYVALGLSDILVHITYGDGLPMALLEAMFLNTPIIASNYFGIPEAIENRKSGILVRNDPEVIGKAIIELISDSQLRRSLASKASKRVREKFRWETTARKLQNILSCENHENR